MQIRLRGLGEMQSVDDAEEVEKEENGNKKPEPERLSRKAKSGAKKLLACNNSNTGGSTSSPAETTFTKPHIPDANKQQAINTVVKNSNKTNDKTTTGGRNNRKATLANKADAGGGKQHQEVKGGTQLSHDQIDDIEKVGSRLPPQRRPNLKTASLNMDEKDATAYLELQDYGGEYTDADYTDHIHPQYQVPPTSRDVATPDKKPKNLPKSVQKNNRETQCSKTV